MTRDEVIQLVTFRLGNRSDMAARAVLEMPLIQTQLLEGNSWLPWFLEVDTAAPNSLATTAQTRYVTLPADFLSEMEEGHLWITVNGARSRLVKQDFDTALARYPESGAPVVYSLGATKIDLFPLPDAVYDLDFKYYGKDADMAAANVQTLWLEHASDLVIALLGEVLAGKHIRNDQLAASFKQDATEAWSRLYAKHTVRSEVNMSRSLGGND